MAHDAQPRPPGRFVVLGHPSKPGGRLLVRRDQVVALECDEPWIEVLLATGQVVRIEADWHQVAAQLTGEGQ